MRHETVTIPSPLRDTARAAERFQRHAMEARATGGGWQSPAVASLYCTALALGRAILQRFRGVDASLAEDLASGLLLRILPELIAAERPHAFFAVALRRDAISWLRRRASRVEQWAEAAPVGPWDAEERASIRSIEARRWLASLSPRERATLLAVGAGEDREDIARALGTSRANVDQIVHRARASREAARDASRRGRRGAGASRYRRANEAPGPSRGPRPTAC